MIFPPILNSYYPVKGLIFVIFLNKRSKGLTMQINFHSLLWSYLPRVPIILTTTVYIIQLFGVIVSYAHQGCIIWSQDYSTSVIL